MTRAEMIEHLSRAEAACMRKLFVRDDPVTGIRRVRRALEAQEQAEGRNTPPPVPAPPVIRLCTRPADHDGPCNGWPRDACLPRIAQTIAQSGSYAKVCAVADPPSHAPDVELSLLSTRNRLLDALPCPLHGRCVTYALDEIARLKRLDTPPHNWSA